MNLIPQSMGTMQLTHNALIGMTRIIAGIMSAMGNSLIFAIRRPVASRMKPPQALKSLIMVGVVSG